MCFHLRECAPCNTEVTEVSPYLLLCLQGDTMLISSIGMITVALLNQSVVLSYIMKGRMYHFKAEAQKLMHMYILVDGLVKWSNAVFKH